MRSRISDRDAENVSVGLSIVIYRDLADADLEAYAGFLRSAAGRYVHKQFREAILDALWAGGDALESELRKAKAKGPAH